MSDAPARLSPEQLFEKVRPSVVVIRVGGGTGSGFFTADGSVVATNAHVVEGAAKARLKFSDGQEADCPVVRAFKDDDIAFLLAARRGPPPPLRASATLKVGQTVMALGNPLGMEFSLSRGIISGVNQEVNGRKFIQTDATIAPGSSGGPLFDEYAMVVGVNAQVRGDKLSLAIPAELVHARLSDALQLWPRLNATLYCLVCGDRSEDPKYCGGCGCERASAAPAPEPAPEAAPAMAHARLAAGPCPACKAQRPADSRYCPRCGASAEA